MTASNQCRVWANQLPACSGKNFIKNLPISLRRRVLTSFLYFWRPLLLLAAQGLCDTLAVNDVACSPLADVASCCNVAEHHEPVESTYAPELRAGAVLDDRFVLDEPVSRSGMATIYRARDTRNDDEVVAVKVPHLRYESDPNFFSRFQREEQIGQKLSHPFILKFLPVEQPKSRPYIVTEYLRGCTLARVLWKTHTPA